VIYTILNGDLSTSLFFCLDQATIDAGKTEGYTGTFVIGTENDAINEIATRRSIWLSENLNLFSVNKDVDPSQNATWVTCNLDNELQNNDQVYEIFDVVNGFYIQSVGLDNAKQTLSQAQINAQKHFVINYLTWESWPPLTKPLSTGVQTL